MLGKKGSRILKLPSVRNCVTSAMTNKLVVIVNSFKVPKIKKILLYEMKFLVPNYSFLQNPWLGGYRPQIPVLSVLCPQLNLLNPPPEQNSWVRHCRTASLSERLLNIVFVCQFIRNAHLRRVKQTWLLSRTCQGAWFKVDSRLGTCLKGKCKQSKDL